MIKLSYVSALLLLLGLAFFIPQATGSEATKGHSNTASLFLHPCSSHTKSEASLISAAQANRVLSYHLNVPGEYVGGGTLDKEAWKWLEGQNRGTDKDKVFELFQDSKKRTMVLLNGIDQDEVRDVVPLSLQNTHKIVDAPHPFSFDALVHSYGERIQEALPFLASPFTGYFSGAVEEAHDVLEDGVEWLLGAQASLSSKVDQIANGPGYKKTLDALDFATDEASAKFHNSLMGLVSYFDSLGSAEVREMEPSFQAVRFDGFEEVKATYGTDSVQYKQAKDALKSVLEATALKLDGLHKEKKQLHSFALLSLPSASSYGDTHELFARSADPLAPFRTGPRNTPFNRRSGEVPGALFSHADVPNVNNAKEGNNIAPRERDFVGKCFTSDGDLNQATKNCSSHGKPKQTQKGGRKCYRCQCQTSTNRKGKRTQWAGAACQKEDISKPFVLLAVSTIALILIALGSVFYLYNEGEKELPSVLAGISIPNK